MHKDDVLYNDGETVVTRGSADAAVLRFLHDPEMPFAKKQLIAEQILEDPHCLPETVQRAEDFLASQNN